MIKYTIYYQFLQDIFKMIYDKNPNNTSTISEIVNTFCKRENEPNDSQVIMLFLLILMQNIQYLQDVV